MAENIVMPDEFYVNTRSKTADEATALGFATYNENNAAFRKRKETIDKWASYGRANAVAGEVRQNTPRAGFKLSEMVTHGGGWNDLSVYWRIVDPEGFELEISAGNVAKLFQYCDIALGNIAGECIWGWDKGNGSKPVLIPTNSALYVEAKRSSDRHHAVSLKLNDIKIGDYVELKNNIQGVFLGRPYYTYHTWDNDNKGKIIEEQIYAVEYEMYGSTYVFLAVKPNVIAVKPAEVALTEKEALTKLQAARRMDKNVGNKLIFASNNHYRSQYVKQFSFNRTTNIRTLLAPLNKDDIVESFKNKRAKKNYDYVDRLIYVGQLECGKLVHIRGCPRLRQSAYEYYIKDENHGVFFVSVNNLTNTSIDDISSTGLVFETPDQSYSMHDEKEIDVEKIEKFYILHIEIDGKATNLGW